LSGVSDVDHQSPFFVSRSFMKAHEFKGQTVAALRALVARGERTVPQLARELNCTEKELLLVITRRLSWKVSTANLSTLGRRELSALANALGTSVSAAAELMLEVMATELLDGALQERRRTRVAARREPLLK
jgi:hypothetical protein